MTPVAGFEVGIGELMGVSGAICLSIATIVTKKHLGNVPFYFILGEVPTQAQYIGGMIILIGLFLGQVGIKARTDRLKTLGVNSMETEQEIEGKIGFKGI